MDEFIHVMTLQGQNQNSPLLDKCATNYLHTHMPLFLLYVGNCSYMNLAFRLSQ